MNLHKPKPIAVMLGSNLYIGQNGIMIYQDGAKYKEFFRINEYYKERSQGSYLAVSLDIKDKYGVREIKLHKSRPVPGTISKDLDIVCNKKHTIVTRKDNTLVIRIEQIEISDISLPIFFPVIRVLEEINPDALIRITGHFYVGAVEIDITDDYFSTGGGGKVSGCVKIPIVGDFFVIHSDGSFSF